MNEAELKSMLDKCEHEIKILRAKNFEFEREVAAFRAIVRIVKLLPIEPEPISEDVLWLIQQAREATEKASVKKTGVSAVADALIAEIPPAPFRISRPANQD